VGWTESLYRLPYMFSFAWKGEEAKTTGIYSEHKAKLVAWARHYTDFWNESMAFCETVAPSFISTSQADLRGATPDAELRYYQAVTGNKVTFADTMEVGRKIWNLQWAIRVMQGRHRNQEKFAPFMYRPPGHPTSPKAVEGPCMRMVSGAGSLSRTCSWTRPAWSCSRLVFTRTYLINTNRTK
jgi:aldehyde:ferredoxin oxidoreductase